MTGRRGIRSKKLQDYRRGYCKLYEEGLARTVGRTRFERDYGVVIRQTT